MEFLMLALGLIIGAALAAVLLHLKNRMRLMEKQSELSTKTRRPHICPSQYKPSRNGVPVAEDRRTRKSDGELSTALPTLSDGWSRA